LARDFSSSRRAPPQRRVEPVLLERLFERLGLHDIGVNRGAMPEGVDAHRDAIEVDMDEEIDNQSLRGLITERDQLAKFPGSVDMQ
jgi:hypothetical protein